MPHITVPPVPPSRADPANFAARADDYLPAFNIAATQANGMFDEMNDIRDAAAASALTALNAPGTSATSTTTAAIGIGQINTFAIQTGKALVAGQTVSIAYRGDPTNRMIGVITGHDPSAGSLSVLPLVSSGGGTYGDWSIALSAPLDLLVASAQDIFAGASAARAVTPAALAAAMALQGLPDAVTITPDLGAGINFGCLLGGNRTLANPVNARSGWGGAILLRQDGTGGRQLAFGSAWRFPGGAPSLSSAAGALDVISYVVSSTSEIVCSLVRNER